jgi:hypothetical protein
VVSFVDVGVVVADDDDDVGVVVVDDDVVVVALPLFITSHYSHHCVHPSPITLPPTSPLREIISNNNYSSPQINLLHYYPK